MPVNGAASQGDVSRGGATQARSPGREQQACGWALSGMRARRCGKSAPRAWGVGWGAPGRLRPMTGSAQRLATCHHSSPREMGMPTWFSSTCAAAHTL